MVDVGYKVAGAYEIRNLVTSQKYVGSSIDIRRKCMQHRSELRRGIHDNPSLQEAWDTYGETAFAFSVLEECDPQDKLKCEQSFLPKERTAEALLSNGFYNQCPVAGSPSGLKKSPEEVERMRERSRNPSAEQRAAVAEANRRRVVSDETRRKISEAHKGSKRSDETRERQRIAATGRRHNEEVRSKISKAKKGKKYSEEAKVKMGRAWVGRRHSEETKAKMRANVLGRRMSEETKAKISATKRLKAQQKSVASTIW